jgi:hypothetical protein
MRSTRITTALAIVLAGMVLAMNAAGQTAKSAAPAPAQAGDETGCKTPLDECTRDRIAALKAQSKSFTAAYRMKPAASLTEDDKAKVQNFDRWLRRQSDLTRELAERGPASTTKAMQESFNQQYMTLQSQMQRESRQFTAISNIMKTKHDTAKNAIANIR